MRREVHTGDMQTREIPSIALPDEGPIDREPEEIVMADKPMESDYAKEAVFMEEPVTIRLERSSERFAPALLDFYVNGKVEWIPVGREWTVKRKYVEVIARAQPYDVRTNVVKHEEREDNKIERYSIAKHPFSVIKDANPRGSEWLTRVMRES